MSEQEFFRTRLLALLDFRFKKSLVLDMAAVCPISLDFGENDLESARFNTGTPIPYNSIGRASDACVWVSTRTGNNPLGRVASEEICRRRTRFHQLP
jgi:hypothetical protein